MLTYLSGRLGVVLLFAAIAGAGFAAEPPPLPTRAAIDARVAQAMVSTKAQGMAVAVIDGVAVGSGSVWKASRRVLPSGT